MVARLLFCLTLTSQLALPQSAPRDRSAGQPYLNRIENRGDFDRLARIYYQRRFFALPHVMFVIDRSAGHRVYYVNSKLYRFHRDFANAAYLSLERGRIFYDNNYLRADRRFILGTVAYQQTIDRFTFEFWEGDQLDEDLLKEAYVALSGSFFAPIAFKPNSQRHQAVADSLRNRSPESPAISVVPASDSALSYQPLNLAAGIGQVRIIETVTAETIFDRNQILILKEAPVHLTPVSGILVSQPTSPLSHINLLARSWGIPNAYLKNAIELLRSLDGKYIRLEVREDDYKIVPADLRQVEERQREWVKRTDLVTPRADLAYSVLTDLRRQRARDATRFGAKSANLGEIINARLPGVTVPPGFTIPFHHFRRFIDRNQLEDRIASVIEEDRFVHDPAYRKVRLAEIRRWIEQSPVDGDLERDILRKVRREYSGKGLFVRSSTNAEDLPGFSGAGLYTTVPNVRDERELLRAIKVVWASIWNYEAYEARDAYGMNHHAVFPAVLIQEGIDADAAGVAITTDPFNRSNAGAIYINAKRGLGIRVVEGKRVAEQLIYTPGTMRIRVLTRSEDDTMLKFDEAGGVREIAIEQRRAVLTDEMAARLARAAQTIKRIFGSVDQDIEWLYARGRLYVVQSRPFVDSQIQ